MMYINTDPTKAVVGRLNKDMYVSGNLSCLDLPIITIVGSRRPSQYGIASCKQITRGLSGHGIATCSGLAIGVDAVVHTESLLNKIPTISIPGSSIDLENLYPRSNTELASRIIHSGGCLLSPWKSQAAAPWTFPARNKLLAEIADIVLVIEATEHSGSLQTAAWAKKSGKIVCAVPGNIDSELSCGTNMLIKDGAQCVTSAIDILNVLSIPAHPSCKNESDDGLLMHLHSPLHKEELLRVSHYSIQTFNEELSLLELLNKISIDVFGIVRKLE